MSLVKFKVDLQKDIKKVVEECPNFINLIENPNEELVATAIENGGFHVFPDDVFEKFFESDSEIIQKAIVAFNPHTLCRIKKPYKSVIRSAIDCNVDALEEVDDKFWKEDPEIVSEIIDKCPKFASNHLYKQMTASQFIEMVRKEKIHYVEKLPVSEDETSYDTRYREQHNERYSGIRAKGSSWRRNTVIDRKFSNKEFEEVSGIKLTIRAKPWLLMCLDNPSTEFQKLAARKLQKFEGLDHILTDKEAIDVYKGYKACEDVIM